MGKDFVEIPFEELLKQNRRLRLILKLIILVLLMIIFALFFFKKNIVPTYFKLNGEELVVVNLGEDEYKEEGVKATLFGRDISKRVKIKNEINYDKLGTYDIKYRLKINELNIDKTLIRKVKIIDKIPPELTVNSEPEIYVNLNEDFARPTYSAVDNMDGDITDKVKVDDSEVNLGVEGEYLIKYSVKDSDGNEATKEIKVIVREKYKNTYIEISMYGQYLNYYEMGKLAISTPVVTGGIGVTPFGSYYIRNKATNVHLLGPEDDPYDSFVYYWMAFIGSSYGIHDATWRSSFGGDIYTYNPSHGCVNVPYDVAEELYYRVEIGTPVYVVE